MRCAASGPAPRWWSACRSGSSAPPSPRRRCAQRPARGVQRLREGRLGRGRRRRQRAALPARRPHERPAAAAGRPRDAGRRGRRRVRGVRRTGAAPARGRRRRRRRVHRAVPAAADRRRRRRWRAAGTGAWRRCRWCWWPPGTPRATSPPRCTREVLRDPGSATPTAARSARTRCCWSCWRSGSTPRWTASRPRRHRGAAGRARLHRPGRQRRGLQGRPAAVGGRGLAMVEPAFVSLARPGVADRARRGAGRSARGGSSCCPTSCSPACCRDRVVEQARAFGMEHPDVEVRVRRR